MSSAAARDKLEVDGISEQFFNLLWMKDELNFGPSINIPDTVIFKAGMPVNWYFTASNGRVKRKSAQNLVSSKIEDAFTKNILGYDVLATFISFPSVQTESGESTESASTIEYFDKEGLYNFLFKIDKKKNGILQRFIEPKGTKNEAIRAIWSPKLCLLERAENIYQLHDQRYGMYERCVTYEGPDFYSVSQPLRGTVLAGQVQKVCETVVSHISEVTYAQKQITRLVMNLKVDSRDKLWLLYTTSIRLADVEGGLKTYEEAMQHFNSSEKKDLVNLGSGLKLPDVVNLNPNPSYEEKDQRKTMTRVRCVSCGTETLDDLRHQVTYKSILKHFDHVVNLLSDIPQSQATALAAARRAIMSQSSEEGKNHRPLIIQWPPDQEIITAAGGVGFGCLDQLNEDMKSRAGKYNFIDIRSDANDVKIPPIIRYLHPKLNSMSYMRCRQDPLFLYKTVSVCESCFLVYAEFMTMYLQMGKGITNFLKADNVPKLPEDSAFVAERRPTSADWRAMSSVHKRPAPSGSQALQSVPQITPFSPSENHIHAMESAIGIRTSDVRRQPEMPTVIRTGEDAAPVHSQLAAGIYSGMMKLPGGERMAINSALEKSMNILSESKMKLTEYDADVIAATAAERERNFFKEISRNPQLRDQHPLMHLISAQQKLLMTTKQSGVLMSKSAAKGESLYSSSYGKQASDKYDSLNAYREELPYLIRGQHILPSKLRELKDIERQKRKEEFRKSKQKLRTMSVGAGLLAPAGSSSVVAEGAMAADAGGAGAGGGGGGGLLSGGASVSGAVAGDGSVTGASLLGAGSIGSGLSDPAAEKHRKFLHNALRSIESEIKFSK